MKLITNKILKLIFPIVLSCFLFSCNEAEDFLAVSNPNRADLTFEDLEDTNKALNGVYNVLIDERLFSPELFGLLSDEGTSGASRIDGSTPIDIASFNISNFSFDNSAGRIGGNWEALYRGVNAANLTIFGLEEIEDSISEDDRDIWNIQMAQARFFRGMFHFFLHSVYNEGRIVLREELVNETQEAPLNLASSEEVIASYVADFNFAIENIPVQTNNPDDDPFVRPTSGTAVMLLANHFLYEEDFSTAISLYQRVINQSGFFLEAPEVLFTDAGAFNNESIFEINFTDEFLVELRPFNAALPTNRLEFQTSSAGNFRPTLVPASWLIAEYQEELLDPLATELNTVINPINASVPEMRSISRRASAMIATNQDEHTPYYLQPRTSAQGGARLNVNNQGAFAANFRKYSNHDIISSVRNAGPPGSANSNQRSSRNIVLMRLSEAYINLAECYIRTGEINEALIQLNILRARWGLVLLGPSNGDASRTYDEIIYTQETLMNHLMFNEKPLELSVEGLATRFIDLRRWSRATLAGTGADRYRDLSRQQFTFRDYTPRFFVPTGGEVRALRDGVIARYPFVENNPLVPFTEDALNDTPRVIHTQYEGTAENYSRFNGYLPIPFDEVNFNTGL